MFQSSFSNTPECQKFSRHSFQPLLKISLHESYVVCQHPRAPSSSIFLQTAIAEDEDMEPIPRRDNGQLAHRIHSIWWSCCTIPNCKAIALMNSNFGNGTDVDIVSREICDATRLDR